MDLFHIFCFVWINVNRSPRFFHETILNALNRILQIVEHTLVVGIAQIVVA